MSVARPRVQFLLAALFFLCGSHLRADSGELAGKVHAFAQKLAASREPVKKPPKDDEKDPRGAYAARQELEIATRLLTQLKLLEAAIGRGDFDAAQQLNGSFGSYPVPPDLTESWSDLVATVATGLEKESKQAAEKWYAEVNALVKETHDVCLAAARSSDLDAILIRIGALQMRRARYENVLTQRGQEKISGVTATLQGWARYLDQRDAGNGKAANEILRGLGNNASQFPVLSAEEINSKLASIEPEPSVVANARTILSELKTPEDVPPAIERWKKLMDDPRFNPNEKSSLNWVMPKLEALERAFAALKSGEDDTAWQLIGSSFEGGQPDLSPPLLRLKNHLVEAAIASRVRALTGASPGGEQGGPGLLAHALDQLQAKGDYAGILELLKLQERIDRTSAAADSALIQRFLAAQRFEKSGDTLAAIDEYRSVVAGSGKYVPQTQAGEALQRLKEKNPEAFKDYEGVVLQELRGLRQQLQTLPNRYPGRPY